MAQHKSYQGHRNRNAWNVSLYIFNEESWYRMAQAAMKSHRTVGEAAEALFHSLPRKTPDGVRVTITNVRLALQNWEG